MTRAKQGRRWLNAAALLVVVQLVALTGCDTGQRNVGGGVIQAAPGCGSGVPFLLGVSTEMACPGEEIELNGLNFSPDLSSNLVTFGDLTGNVQITGIVTGFVDNGSHPVFNCPDTTLIVRVPTGARTGTISVTVVQPDESKIDAGSVAFTGCPQVIGFGQGADAAPFLSVDAGFNFLTDQFQIFGYGLTTITEVNVTDPDGQVILNSTVASGFGTTNPNYTLPNGLEVVTVTLDPPGTVVPSCSTYYLGVKLTDASTGVPVESNEVIIPVREQFAPGEFEDMPGTIVGCVVPSGARRGILPLYYNLCMDPCQARYDVIPEFLSPAGTWLPCTGVSANEGVRVLPGVPGMSTEYPVIVSGGASSVFRWDTVADGLVYDAVNGVPFATRVRFRIENPFPAVATCPTAPPSDAMFETALILIDNPGNIATIPPTPLPSDGSIAESFNDATQFDDQLSDDEVSWDGSTGFLLGQPTPGVPWGSGTSDVICLAGGTYEFNTVTGSITDQTVAGNPIPLHLPSVGDPVGV
ncbi:MAG: hypothetical protein KDC38_09165, partial [Planctomycetes bacterium]|nr:hypothetical protein [Planctomycetota bacterium]